MQIARYPRHGASLAPRILAPVLQIPAAMTGLLSNTRLSDLDEESWAKYGPDVCRKLADRIVQQVARRLHSLPTEIKERTLQSIANRGNINFVEVGVRTRNCLLRLKSAAERNDHPRLGVVTVADLVRTRAFGARCLVDLLVALETLAALPQVNKKDSENAESGQLTIAATALMNNEVSESIRCDDPRVGPRVKRLRTLLQSLGYLTWPDTTVWEIGERFMSRRNDPADIAGAIREINAVNDFISALRVEVLETELGDIVTSATTSPRNAQLVARYFGFDGRGVQTLQCVGDEYGLTRERVRQICDGAVHLWSTTRPFVPKLQMALTLVKSRMSATETGVEARLIEAGITRGPFRTSGLFKAAQLFQLKAPITEEEFQSTLLSGRSGEAIKARIVQVARKAVSFWGVTTAVFVQEKLREQSEYEVPLDAEVEVLSAEHDFVWLAQDAGWFWLQDEPRNHLITRIKKIMAVCARLDVTELRAAISRDPRTHGFAPPKRILLALCSNLPFCAVNDNEITRAVVLDPRRILADREYSVYSVLAEHGPLMYSSDFEAACFAKGINRHTVTALKTHSPIVARFAPSIYGLRGAVFAPGLLASMMARMPVLSRVTQDYGWTSDGKPWIAYRVSRGMLNAGVLNIPSGMKRFLRGRFAYPRPEDGSEGGAIVVDARRAWGIGPFLRHQSVEPGDTLVILFDITAHRAEIRMGDADLVLTNPSHISDNAELTLN